MDTWQLPDPDPRSLHFEFAHSILEEFILGHDPSDVLRELIQNEYDAGGTRLEVNFASDAVTVRGNGKPIDAAGWSRLSVMLGRGRVAGSDRVIQEKTNGIGSKNFGLRSLFLVGDRIYIRSGGKQTCLDWMAGALQSPLDEPGSRRRQGVEICVPYRQKRVQRLEPFTPEREERALKSYVQNMSSILVKLAQPGAGKSLDQVIVTSERVGTGLQWKQSARKVRCAAQGITAVQRRVLIRASGATNNGGEAPGSLEEIEFQKLLVLPPEYRGKPIPGYFKVPGGRIRIGVSLRVRRGRLCLDEPGLLYYPLGVTAGHTGNAVSICAPFQMDSDRSQIQAPDSSSLNDWLLRQAADLTMSLLVSDWFGRFGGDIYLALKRCTDPRVGVYLNEVLSRLKSAVCWPSRKQQGRQPVWATASKLVAPECPELDGFLGDDQYLHADLVANRNLVAFARECGVKVFTANSLVRLRCYPFDSKGMATKIGSTEANYCYSGFPNDLQDSATQQRFSRALDAPSVRLSEANRKDLAQSCTTMASAGNLASPGQLWRLTPEVAAAAPIPESQQLHPALVSCKVLAKMCRSFRIPDWVQDVVENLPKSGATDPRRMALYKYILARHGRLDRRSLRMIRKAPILLDHRGEWVTPGAIVRLRSSFTSTLLEPALHYPHPDYADDSELAKVLRFRTTIGGDDVIAFAKLVAARPVTATEFEALLARSTQLLTPLVVSAFAVIAFLPTSLDRPCKPTEVYVPNRLTLACLDAENPFTAGKYRSLYERLGCPTAPHSTHIVQSLIRRLGRGVGPEHPDIVYPALVDALREEKQDTGTYRQVSIIWADGRHVKPIDLLVGTKKRAEFLGAIPQLEGSREMCAALNALGARYTPEEAHWVKLLQWVSDKYGKSGTPVPADVLHALRVAMNALAVPPAALLSTTKFMPDRTGRLYSLEDAKSGRYVIDDEPLSRAGELSAVLANKIPQENWKFWLTPARGEFCFGAKEPPNWWRPLLL